MKIGYDAKRLFHNNSGLGNYSRTLVKNLHENYPEEDLVLFTPPPSSPTNKYAAPFNKCKTIEGSNNPFWRYSSMTREIQKEDLDIYHGLSNELPFGITKIRKIKKVVTIHDLVFLRYPKLYSLIDRNIYKEKFRRACNDADRIIAISQNTKNDIVDFFGIQEKKIEVIYQTCSEIYFDKFLPVNMREDLLFNRPYGLFVSSITERKNLISVLKALKDVPKVHRPLLIVIGKGGKYRLKMQTWVTENLSDDVRFFDDVDDYELKYLYSKAHFSIYPSLYEGYGIPILESLLCGTPVIASNTSSMPEVGEGLAKLVDPNSISELKLLISNLSSKKERISQNDISSLKMTFNSKKTSEILMNFYLELF